MAVTKNVVKPAAAAPAAAAPASKVGEAKNPALIAAKAKSVATIAAAKAAKVAATPAPAPTPEAAEPESKVTRKDIAAAIREKIISAGKAVPLPIAEIMVVAYEEVIGEALASGNVVNLPGFGKFTPVAKPEAQSRNPKTGEPVTVPAHTAVRFKPGAKLKATVNSGVEVADGEEAAEAA